MGGLPKSPVSWPITGAISTKNAPVMLKAPFAITADNVRQERLNEWRTRPGNTSDVRDSMSVENIPVIATEAPWGGLFGLCRRTDSTSAGRNFEPGANVRRWTTPAPQALSGSTIVQTCAQTTPSIWKRQGIAAGTDPITQTSVAEGDGFRITAWSRNSPGSGVQALLSATDGAAVEYYAQVGALPNAARPKCVYSSTAGILVLFFHDAATGNLYATRWTTSSGGNAGLETLAVGNCLSNLDAYWYGGATITLVYQNAANNLTQGEYNPSNGTFTEYPIAIDAQNSLALMSDPDASGIRGIAVCTVTPEVRVLRTNSTGVIQTNHLAQAVDAPQMAGVLYESGASWMLVYETSTELRAVKRRAGVTSAVKVLGDIRNNGTRYYTLSSAAWREPSTDAMHYILGLQGTSDDPHNTYFEMALEFENGNAAIFDYWHEPQARLLVHQAGVAAGARATLPQAQRLGTDRFALSLARVTRTNIAGDASAVVLFDYAVDAWTVQYMNTTTYTGQRQQGGGAMTQTCLFLPVGSLLQTATGQIPCAHGAGAIPFKPALTPAVAAGALTPGSRYSYVVSVEMLDELGNTWRSEVSEVATVTLTPNPGGQNQVTVAFNLHPFENQARRRIVRIWRTAANGSAYRLLYKVNGTISATNSISYVDVVSDTALSTAELLTAELQATVTPGLSHVAVWNDRMWGVLRDFPSRIRYSKPLAAGFLPEFPDEFIVDLDDAEGDITNLVPMDDRIVALKGSAVYIAGGDGPGNTGDGPQFDFTLISSDVGSIAGSPVLSTGDAVYMVAPGGLHRLTKSQETQFVSEIDLYLSMPLLASPETVTGMMLSPGTNEVRIQTTHYRFVEDRTFGIWYRDTGGFATTTVYMTKVLGDGTQVFFTSAGLLWREAADSTTPTDAGTAYQALIRSPWIRPTDVGGWLRLYRARLEATVTATGTDTGTAFTIYFNDDDTLFEAFQPSVANIAAAAGLVRADARPKRQKCSSFSLQFTFPSGDATVRLEEWWTLVAPKAGSPPWLASERWVT